MRKGFIWLSILALLSIGAFAQEQTIGLTVNVEAFFSYSLTFGVTSVEITPPRPPSWGRMTGSGPFSSTCDILTSYEAVQLQWKADNLVSGGDTIPCGQIYILGTGDFAVGLTKCNASYGAIANWTAGLDAQKVGTLELRYEEGEDDPLGVYTTTIYFKCVAL